MASLTVVQFILIVLALEVISAPIIIFICNSVLIAFYRLKEQHEEAKAKAVADATNSLMKSFSEFKTRVSDATGNNKEDQV